MVSSHRGVLHSGVALRGAPLHIAFKAVCRLHVNLLYLLVTCKYDASNVKGYRNSVVVNLCLLLIVLFFCRS